jgi:hypothetical protein
MLAPHHRAVVLGTKLKFQDGIHYDARVSPQNGGRCYAKVPGGALVRGTLTDVFTFTGDNKSMYRAANGLLVPSVTNTPRIEYDASGNLLGLLVEGARTNLCLQSQDIATTWTNNRSSESTNSTTAPDGTATADTLIEDNTNGQHYVTQGITVTTNPVTFTAFFKAKERTFGLLNVFDGTTACAARFDLTLGTVGTVDATLSGSASIQAFGNGWYRCRLTVTPAATSCTFQLSMTTSSSGFGYQGDNASGIYVWGAQVEQASFPSSYIPTTTGSVARAGDFPTRTFGAEVSQTAGTYFAEFDLTGVNTGGQQTILGIDDGTSNELIRARQDTNGWAPLQVSDGGVSQANIIVAGTPDTALHRMAGAYALNDMVGALDGALGTPDVSGTLPTTTTILLGHRTSVSAAPLFGHIRRLSYWPERKTNAFLQQITA